jgi:hypothetical protein
MDAANRVFHTPELFEMILLNLEYFELLQVQRVCSAWRDYISDVKSIQKRLWKRPKKINEKDGEEPLFTRRHIISAARPLLPDGRDGLMVLDSLTKKVLESDLKYNTTRAYARQHKLINQRMKVPLDPQIPGDLHPGIPNHCFTCSTYHTKDFKYDCLHPLLRFLEQYECICIQGCTSPGRGSLPGPRLSLLVSLPKLTHLNCVVHFDCLPGLEGDDEERGWTDGLIDMQRLCHDLRSALELARVAGLGQDLVTQPPCTLLAVDDTSGSNFHFHEAAHHTTVMQALFDIAECVHFSFVAVERHWTEDAWNWAVTGVTPDWEIIGTMMSNVDIIQRLHTDLHHLMVELWCECEDCYYDTDDDSRRFNNWLYIWLSGDP